MSESSQKQRIWALLALSLILFVAYYGLNPTRVSDIEANRAHFDGKIVTVFGTVRAVSEHMSRVGNRYITFVICDEACVRVFKWGDAGVTNRSKTFVVGRYRLVRNIGRYHFYNEIDAFLP